MDALPGIARSIREVELLLLLVTGLFYLVARDAILSTTGWFLTLLVFAVAVLASSALPRLRREPRLRVATEVVLMTLFITALIAEAGERAAPLSHLYLLPVVTAALLLGRRATGLLLLVILGARLLLGVAVQGPGWLALSPLIGLFAELAPTLLVAFLTCALSSDLDRATRTILFLAERDDLTKLYNLRSFSKLADAEFRQAEQDGAPVALVMVDVSQLAEINDRFGHEAGDKALRAVAAAIQRATRSGDLCARYGGDEFVILLPRCGRRAADVVASRIRHDVFAGTQDFGYAMRRLTVAVGVAASPEDGHELQILFRRAVRNLHKEKQAREARVPGEFTAPRELAP